VQIIETQNLSKSFDSNTYAVNNLSLSLSAGEVLGFLGPNGSGKTTTVRLINGILNPSAGKIFIKGKELTPDNASDIHTISGVLTENAEFYSYLTGYENLMFFGTLCDIEPSELKSRCLKLLERFEILDAKDKVVKNYSTGMKKRLKLARAFLNNPQIIFLDEPTSGLDPEGAKMVNDFIKKAAEDFKVTVFLCTHQLKYAEDICSVYGFIDNGKLIAFGKFSDLLNDVDSSVYLEIKGQNFPEMFKSNLNNGVLSIKISGNEDASRLITEITLNGGQIYEAIQRKMNLEELYFAIQGKNNAK
jgi:ABC-2 type transport system ATP-binding protein